MYSAHVKSVVYCQHYHISVKLVSHVSENKRNWHVCLSNISKNMARKAFFSCFNKSIESLTYTSAYMASVGESK